jgi:signal transduction histidine kinase
VTALPAAEPDDAVVTEALMQRRFSLMAAQVLALRWSFVSLTAVIAVVAWQAVPAAWVLVWFSAALLIFGLRARWLSRHVAQADAPARYKVRGAIAWNVALGLVYGLSATFMFLLDQTMSAVLTTIVVSSAAGAVAISGPLLPVYLAYTLSIMVPFAAVWAATGGALGIGLALLMVMFTSVQYRFARKVSQTFTESFLIRRENEQLVAQLTVARDQADAASIAKTRFLAAASHDLRQPLHALSLQSSALLLDPHADDTPAIAAAIAESIDDVTTLLDSLLDISKLDAGTLRADKRPIHLSRMLDSLARSFAPWVESKGLRFEMHNTAGEIAVTDPMLLERVLRNLVDNAVKFTPAGTVSLSLQVQPDHFELCVGDTGVGIPADLQAKVFDEFFQVNRHAQGHTQGLGLGLSIVSRLAHLLGMSVGLESEPGAGTRVKLRLPRPEADAVPAAAPAVATASTDLGGVRVLVLDDEPAICAGMAALLKKLGCNVRSASTLAEARAEAAAFAPRIVLADYRLADDANGIDAIARLRADHPQLLAVLISGDTAPDRLREASASGLELLHKPVSLAQLRRTLSALVAAGA